MSKYETGGPAFPETPVGETYEGSSGMSLRDYFAAKALPGCIAAIMSLECHRWFPTDFAQEAYKMADAMLEERAK